MAYQSRRMEEVRQIIRTYLETEKYKVVARQLGISKNTVRKYVRLAEQLEISKEELLTLDDEQLKTLIYPETVILDSERIGIFEEKVNYWLSELGRVGVTRQLLWKEYKGEHPDGFEYSQFCERLGQHIQSRKLTIHLKHEPAREMMADFAGQKLSWINRDTGEIIPAEIIAAVLPYSQYTFAMAINSQQTPDVIHGLNQTFLFFGGTPHAMLSDNFAAYVKKADRYEPAFTELCNQLGAHYHIDLQACRVGRPKDKASVENIISTIYTRIYAKMRNEQHFSLSELNHAIRKRLVDHNNEPFQKRPGSRRSIFEQYEKPLLRPLPTTLFELRKQKKATVGKNYHIYLGQEKEYYSVHFSHVGKRVDVRYSSTILEIYYKQSRIAVHERTGKKYTTNAQHMPEKHKIYEQLSGYTSKEFTSLAESIGQMTHWAIQQILISTFYEEQSYISCLGVLNLANRFSHERLEAACSRCYQIGQVNYGLLKRILDKNLDQSEPDLFTTKSLSDHENIRGKDAYQ